MQVEGLILIKIGIVSISCEELYKLSCLALHIYQSCVHYWINFPPKQIEAKFSKFATNLRKELITTFEKMIDLYAFVALPPYSESIKIPQLPTVRDIKLLLSKPPTDEFNLMKYLSRGSTILNMPLPKRNPLLEQSITSTQPMHTVQYSAEEQNTSKFNTDKIPNKQTAIKPIETQEVIENPNGNPLPQEYPIESPIKSGNPPIEAIKKSGNDLSNLEAEIAKVNISQPAQPIEEPKANTKPRQESLIELDEIASPNIIPNPTKATNPMPIPMVKKSQDSDKIIDVFNEEYKQNGFNMIIDYSELQVEKTIGCGATAEVFKGKFRGSDVAIKMLKTSSLNESLIKEFSREVTVLSTMRNPNLVLFIGACNNVKSPCIVTEFCFGGSLFELLHVNTKVNLSWKQKIKIAFDISKGLQYLHMCKPPLIHRDLKSLNILLAEKVTGPYDAIAAKITDFGLSRFYILGNADKMTTQAGTFHWMAPEVFENKPYNEKADIYSFGVMLWEIICRKAPYANMTPYQIMYKVMKGGRPDETLIPQDAPLELVKIMQQCWDTQQEKRPSSAKISELLGNLYHKD